MNHYSTILAPNTITIDLQQGQFVDDIDLKSIVEKHGFIRLLAGTGKGKNYACRNQFPNAVIIEPALLKCRQELRDYPNSYQAFGGICTIPDGVKTGQIVTTFESFFSRVRTKINPEDQKRFTIIMDEMHLIALAIYRRKSIKNMVAYLQAKWGGVVIMSGTDAPLVGDFFNKFVAAKVNAPKRTQNTQLVFYEPGQAPHVIADLINRTRRQFGKKFRILVKLDDTDPTGEAAAVTHECGLLDGQIGYVNSKTEHEPDSQSFINGQWPNKNVIFATGVFETGLNVNDDVDVVIFADAPGSQSAEQTVNRFRKNAPKMTYVLVSNCKRIGQDTKFSPDKLVKDTYNMASTIANTLNNPTNDPNDPLSQMAHKYAQQLKGMIAIDTDGAGNKFYIPDDTLLSQDTAARIYSMERAYPEFFKRRMAAYGWNFQPDETFSLDVSNEAKTAVKNARHAAKVERENDLEKHCAAIIQMGEIRARDALKNRIGEDFLLEIISSVLVIVEYVTDWKTAVNLAKETGGKSGKLNKLKRALKTQQDRLDLNPYTLQVYDIFSDTNIQTWATGLGRKNDDCLFTLARAKTEILRQFWHDRRLRPYIKMQNFITEKDVSAFLRCHFKIERVQRRKGGKTISFYRIIDNSPCMGGVRLVDIVTPKGAGIWGVSQQNSYKYTKTPVTSTP